MPIHGTIDIRSIARAISCVENRSTGAGELLRKAYTGARHVPIIGITGPPGAGKSTLIDRLAVHWADRGDAVAVLAVDPSSPFTGGAVLGDRLRMGSAAGHPRVFVRSLSSRGRLGGLSNAAVDAAAILAHLGFDRVLLETVGAGQSDIDVGEIADAVLVLAVPGLGDHVQAAKAGFLEIGDVCAVNKFDLPGATSTIGHLEANLDLIYPGSPGRNASRNCAADVPLPGNATLHRRHGDRTDPLGHWRPPVLAVSARNGTGIEALAAALDQFIAWLRDTGRHEARVADRFRAHVLRIVQARLLARWLDAAGAESLKLQALAVQMAHGELTPDEAADWLMAGI